MDGKWVGGTAQGHRSGSFCSSCVAIDLLMTLNTSVSTFLLNNKRGRLSPPPFFLFSFHLPACSNSFFISVVCLSWLQGRRFTEKIKHGPNGDDFLVQYQLFKIMLVIIKYWLLLGSKNKHRIKDSSVVHLFMFSRSLLFCTFFSVCRLKICNLKVVEYLPL